MYQTKDNNHQTGNEKESCPFYRELDAILETRASSEPVVVLENCGVARVELEQPKGDGVIVSYVGYIALHRFGG